MFRKWGVFQVGWKCLIAKATQTIIASSVNRTTSQTQREQVCFTSQTRSAERRSPVRGVQLWECPGVAVVQSLPAVPCLPRSHLEGASNPASIRQATGPFCCGWSGRGEEENMVKIMWRWTEVFPQLTLSLNKCDFIGEVEYVCVGVLVPKMVAHERGILCWYIS